MSSLWTPGGEHRVEREPSRPAGGGAPGGGPAHPAPSAEEEAAAAELADLERQLLAVPAGDVIANHCYGLFELAALHLSQQPPHFDEARLAIDALGLVVEGLGERLGAAAATLGDGLAQIRLAFVQLSGAPGASASGAAEPGAPEGGESS